MFFILKKQLIRFKFIFFLKKNLNFIKFRNGRPASPPEEGTPDAHVPSGRGDAGNGRGRTASPPEEGTWEIHVPSSGGNVGFHVPSGRGDAGFRRLLLRRGRKIPFSLFFNCFLKKKPKLIKKKLTGGCRFLSRSKSDIFVKYEFVKS